MSISDDKINPDQLQGFLHPRQNIELFGHDNALDQFQLAYNGDKLHHAWLLLGKQGIGKATLAYRFAKYVLSSHKEKSAGSTGLQIDPTNHHAQLVTSNSHPNLLVLRRAWNAKTKKFKPRISVDDVRELQRFLGNTAGMGKWRIVIIDRADDLNMNAANALLKMLEEPPDFCLFLLISSEPGKLPTTIRSRCQKMRLGALDEQCLKNAVSHNAKQSDTTLPQGEQLAEILKLADGSVRQALEFATGADPERSQGDRKNSRSVASHGPPENDSADRTPVRAHQ